MVRMSGKWRQGSAEELVGSEPGGSRNSSEFVVPQSTRPKTVVMAHRSTLRVILRAR